VLNIGISVMATSGANIWNNGLNQNLAFLLMLLRGCPQVGNIWLLNGGDTEELPPALEFHSLGAKLVRPHEVTYQLDMVIEMGAQLPLEWLRRVHAQGTRVVLFMVGSLTLDMAHQAVFDRPGGMVLNGAPWDEVWILPQHARTSAPMLRTVTRAPVIVMPHLWAPTFVDPSIALMQAGGWRFGFQPGRRGRPWRVAMFEPNLGVVKASFIPMLICEEAYRRQREAVSLMLVVNSFHMKEHATFNRMAANLDLTRDHKATYEPRLVFVECMAQQQVDAVVAHHWECGLNYAYYDALYGGYPLVHNSEFLQAAGQGIYYPEFRATEGAGALLRAWEQEPGFWEGYRRSALMFLKGLAPENPMNRQAFAARLRRNGPP